MRKIVLATLLVTGLMAADSGLYVGVDYGVASNTTTIEDSDGYTFDGTNDYNDLKIKIGSGADGDWKTQFYISFSNYDVNPIDYTGNGALTELGLDFIKEFEVTQAVYPFIKFGFGVGGMSVEGFDQSTAYEASLNAGIGLSYKAVDNLYLLLGADYIYRQWQDVDYYAWTRSTNDSGIKPYVGVNYRF